MQSLYEKTNIERDKKKTMLLCDTIAAINFVASVYEAAFAGIAVCLYFRRDKEIWRLEEN